jgi:parvulin-like peptidyl-prolyl isomerase
MKSYQRCITVLLLIPLVVSCGKNAPSTPNTTPSNTPASIATTMNTPLPSATMASPTATQSSVLPVATPTVRLPDPTPTAPANTAALVNGKPIPLPDFEVQVEQAMSYLKQQPNFDSNSQEGQAAISQLRRQVLSWMIDQAVIEQTAAREGVSVSEDQVQAEITRLIGNDPDKFDEWLKTNGLTRETFQSQLQRELLGVALQEHVIGSDSPIVEQVHARHILLASETEAMDVLLKLRSGGDFAELAKQYSQDKGSSQTGGDLGFFPRSIMPNEIEAVAFSLSPGEISGIVKSDFGYHVIQVIEKDPARKVSDEMLATWRQKSFLRWLEAQRSVAKVFTYVSFD